MKLVLASYFQEENHGPGRKIGISPGKPRDNDCDFRFDSLDPGELYWDYHKNKDDNSAGKIFVDAYRLQCEAFVEEVKQAAKDEGKTVFDVLPFEEGDTLLSWESKGHTSYRSIAAEYLQELGYEVEEN